jgi:hypothetical protein
MDIQTMGLFTFQICPDFSADAIQKVLDLINTGSTLVGSEDENLIQEMKEIFKAFCLGIDRSVFDPVSNLNDENCPPTAEKTKPESLNNNQCKVCNKKFFEKVALNHHLAIFHPIFYQPDKNGENQNEKTDTHRLNTEMSKSFIDFEDQLKPFR